MTDEALLPGPPTGAQAAWPEPLFSALWLWLGCCLFVATEIALLRALGVNDDEAMITSFAVISVPISLGLGQLIRWRFRISIRGILLVTAAVAGVCALVGRELLEAESQRARVQAVAAKSYSITYDKRGAGDVHGKWFITRSGFPLPVWLAKRLGPEAFAGIYTLWCDKLTNEDVNLLSDLPPVAWLNVVSSPLDAQGLAKLPVMPGMRTLEISGRQVSAGSISRLAMQPDLRHVEIQGEVTSMEGLRSLHQVPQVQSIVVDAFELDRETCRALAENPHLTELMLNTLARKDDIPHFSSMAPRLKLSAATIIEELAKSESVEVLHIGYVERVRDPHLELLISMRSLRQLDLSGSSITQEGVNKFKAARPDVSVTY